MPRANCGQRCLHCERRVANGTRGLCRACQTTPGLKAMYPVRHRGYYPREVVVGVCPPVGVDAPTDCRPGTAEKVAVLERRAAAGLELWHPNDLRG